MPCRQRQALPPCCRPRTAPPLTQAPSPLLHPSTQLPSHLPPIGGRRRRWLPRHRLARTLALPFARPLCTAARLPALSCSAAPAFCAALAPCLPLLQPPVPISGGRRGGWWARRHGAAAGAHAGPAGPSPPTHPCPHALPKRVRKGGGGESGCGRGGGGSARGWVVRSARRRAKQAAGQGVGLCGVCARANCASPYFPALFPHSRPSPAPRPQH